MISKIRNCKFAVLSMIITAVLMVAAAVVCLVPAGSTQAQAATSDATFEVALRVGDTVITKGEDGYYTVTMTDENKQSTVTVNEKAVGTVEEFVSYFGIESGTEAKLTATDDSNVFFFNRRRFHVVICGRRCFFWYNAFRL